ncbi:MAG: CHAT domain-containing protein [Candidatus Krumholzibacteriia bacterium]
MRRRAGLRGLVCIVLWGASAVPARESAPAWPAVLDSLTAWHHRSRPDQVDALAGPAIEAARVRGDSLALGALLLARGRTRAAFGRASAAEPDLRRSLTLVTAANDTASELRNLRWLAVAVGLQGRTAEARRLYRELSRLAAAVDDSVHLGWAWVGLAYDHYLAGRADSAAASYQRAAGVLDRAGVSRGAIWARNGEGLARRQAGDFVGAARSFADALALARAADDPLNEAVALNHLGQLALQFGAPARAEVMLEQASRIHRANRHLREGLLPQLDMARARRALGHVNAAAALLDSVLQVCREHGLADLEVVATCQLADLALEEGQPARAAAACRGQLSRTLPSTMAATEVRLRLAHALAARDSVTAALAVLPAADATGASSLEVAVAALRGRLLVSLGRGADAVALLAPMAVPHPGDPDRDLLVTPLFTALAAAELARGRPDSALVNCRRALARWERSRAMPEDPRWRERRGADAADMVSLALSASLQLGEVAAAHDLVRRYKVRTLRERWAPTGWPGVADGLSRAGPPAATDDVLADGDVLLDVVEGPEVVTIFCVTADTLLATQLVRAPAWASGLRQLTSVLTSDAVADAAPAVRLAAGLLAPLPPAMRARLQTARRLFWCPDGAWHRLPPALLVGVDGWMPAACEVVRVPAADLMPWFRDRVAALRPAGRVLAVFGAESSRPAGTPLAGAAAEVRRLAARFRHVRAVAGDRLPEIVRPRDPDRPAYDVLHLAAHTVSVADDPWRSSVGLGARPGSRLWAAEVASSGLAAPLVVLSGCRTAGQSLAGEGLLGLGSGFLVDGATSVVATLWDVDDHVTARVMADFYDGLADGRSVSGALALARQRCRERPATAAPRNWAAFTVLGDGTQRVALQRRSDGWPLGLLLLAGAVLAAWRARTFRARV